MTRTRKKPITREDLKKATWITVLGNNSTEFRGSRGAESYTSDLGGYIFPVDWLCEKAKESLRNEEAVPCSPMPGPGFKELIHFAIDNGFFDDDLADGMFEKFKGEVEEEE